MLPSVLFRLVAALAVAAPVFGVRTCALPRHRTNDGIGPLLMETYRDCVSKGGKGSVLFVPPGTHQLKSNVVFSRANDWTLRIDGDVNIPFNPKLGGTMFLFELSNGVSLVGKGRILGNGHQYRPNGQLGKYPNRPRLLRFQLTNNCIIQGITLVNSPMFHLTVIGNNNVVQWVTVEADRIGTTDGIDISGNNNYVSDVTVTNGDECVTVKSPTHGFVAERITCHGSAGNNIGSFGLDPHSPAVADVSNVTYRHVTMDGSDAGVMIKASPFSTGLVRDVTYEDFHLTNVAHPIDIDFGWCPHARCAAPTGSITVQNAVFKGFRVLGKSGASQRPVVGFNCLRGHECTDIRVIGLNAQGSSEYGPNQVNNARVAWN
ncbi:hypothetical protein HKX48_004500 [Thoreauomyces humboldtii]|nr:hypothetical protein HKX48_004500 [Thoreauomyces humboldtii]